jgi:ADP-heptose:LPS heptosyltransferase
LIPGAYKVRRALNALRLALYFATRVKKPKTPASRLLIVKNDSIGDYIICRNFFEALKNDGAFKDLEFYLITTARLAPVAEELDGAIFREVILLPDLSAMPVAAQIKKYKNLARYQFKYLLHPTYSPDAFTQQLVKFIPAGAKVGFAGDLVNQSAGIKAYYERYYDKLIRVEEKFSHEFTKNQVFFSNLMQRPTALTKPELRVLATTDKNAIVICPGAQQVIRRWAPANFGRLINLLSEKNPAYSFTVVTGPGEDQLYDMIGAETRISLKHHRISSVKTLAELIAAAQLVICNDSAPAHMAVACNTSSVCISNGNNYGRFVPYPGSVPSRQKVIFPPAFLSDLAKGQAYEKYYRGSKLDINEINAQTVFESCMAYLSNV